MMNIEIIEIIKPLLYARIRPPPIFHENAFLRKWLL